VGGGFGYGRTLQCVILIGIGTSRRAPLFTNLSDEHDGSPKKGQGVLPPGALLGAGCTVRHRIGELAWVR
jgi:hypothetical protein